MEKKKCPICRKIIYGQSDKKFCNHVCKNIYHSRLKKSTQEATKQVDKVLHRNRSILLELLLKKRKLQIDKLKLEQKGFKFQYCTGNYINSQGKTCYYVHDFLWFELSNPQVYINRIK